MMNLQQYEIWLADLNLQFGTETRKIKPVVIVQTDLLNLTHPSTIICPITTDVKAKSGILCIHLKKGESNVHADCEIMIDQIRAIYNKRLIRRTGTLTQKRILQLIDSLKVIMDL